MTRSHHHEKKSLCYRGCFVKTIVELSLPLLTALILKWHKERFKLTKIVQKRTVGNNTTTVGVLDVINKTKTYIIQANQRTLSVSKNGKKNTKNSSGNNSVRNKILSKICFIHTVTFVLNSEISQITDNSMKRGLPQVIFMGPLTF